MWAVFRLLFRRSSFKISDLTESQILSGGSVKHAVYVDNFAAVSTKTTEATGTVQSAKNVLEALRLGCHEVQPASSSAELTGLKFDGSRFEVRTSSKRVWRLRYAIELIVDWKFERDRTQEDHLPFHVGVFTEKRGFKCSVGLLRLRRGRG